MWGRFTFLLPFAALFVLWRGAPALAPGFTGACLAFGASQLVAARALSKALKLAPFSLVSPLWKVSLLFLLVLGYTLREDNCLNNWVKIAKTPGLRSLPPPVSVNIFYRL